MERRRELAKLLAGTAVPSTGGKPVQADAQAASLAFYIRAAGWKADDAAVGTWLNLGMVLFLELAAGLGATVAAALRPVGGRRTPVQEFPSQRQPEAEKPAAALPEPREKAAKGRGRPPRERKEAEVAILGQLKANGGQLPASSTRKLGRLLDVRKSTAHSALLGLIAAGVVAKTAAGVLVLNG